jgi:hypothetical protein
MKLDEAIAGTLGSLDELEQELIEKQTELANELADVETALSRITAIREAAIGGGKSPKKRDARNDRQRIEENREAVLGHLRTLDEPVRAGAIAEALDRDPRGTGAILSGLVKVGLVTRYDDDNGGAPSYQAAEGTT